MVAGTTTFQISPQNPLREGSVWGGDGGAASKRVLRLGQVKGGRGERRENDAVQGSANISMSVPGEPSYSNPALLVWSPLIN